MRTKKSVFFIVVLVTLLLTAVAVFGIHSEFLNIDLKGAGEMRWGIDIRGGVDAVFVPKDFEGTPSAEELAAACTVMETRLDGKQILDRDVAYDLANGTVIVRFPWQSGETDFDPASAIQELGAMAELTFKDPSGNTVMTGRDVEPGGAAVLLNPETGMDYIVTLNLNDEGTTKFADATASLVGQAISIYLDDQLKSAPTVNEAITTGEAVISGGFTQADATALRDTINGGALPFSMTTFNYSAISPTLGSSALNVMLYAGIISFLLICAFMVLYYRLSGVVAVVALTLQVAGTLLVLSLAQLTVTLQGIAGIILTVGMGVDANVVIAERIRDELKSGKSLDSSIVSGFKRAFSAVFDGNLTTLLVALVMMILGSGAILSFAYTLAFGILMNFVAGVFANRLMTQSITRFKAFRKNSFFIGERGMKKELKIRDFYGKRKIAFLLSGVVIAAGIAFCFIPGFGVNLDIQFSGGAIFRYDVTDPVAINPEEAASEISSLLGRTVSGQVTTDFATNESRLVLNMASGENLSPEDIASMETALLAKYPNQNLTPAESNNVSAMYGARFLSRGLWAIIISCVLMVLYVWFSFRRIHGLTAGVTGLIALLHDVAIVFFTFVIFGIPIGDTFIAVVLTILGYSINDTIVIYDRIRENAIFDPSTAPDVLVNKSISQTLSRTVNTSLTTLTTMVVVYIFALLNGLSGIQSFALPMAVGMVSGCYSTVCIAGPLWVMRQKSRMRKSR
ncbi:MAG: protein translocase subunit SecF [Oscillospiraceae bacterium]|jgi:SecD/SecF fusion protein|nr:protein translocase subunit SecF [Oscillospiraceae bacterium]